MTSHNSQLTTPSRILDPSPGTGHAGSKNRGILPHFQSRKSNRLQFPALVLLLAVSIGLFFAASLTLALCCCYAGCFLAGFSTLQLLSNQRAARSTPRFLIGGGQLVVQQVPSLSSAHQGWGKAVVLGSLALCFAALSLVVQAREGERMKGYSFAARPVTPEDAALFSFADESSFRRSKEQPLAQSVSMAQPAAASSIRELLSLRRAAGGAGRAIHTTSTGASIEGSAYGNSNSRDTSAMKPANHSPAFPSPPLAPHRQPAEALPGKIKEPILHPQWDNTPPRHSQRRRFLAS